MSACLLLETLRAHVRSLSIGTGEWESHSVFIGLGRSRHRRRLFPSQQAPAPAANLSYSRAEAARIAMRSASRRDSSDLAEDRAHLLRIVSARTGLTGANAEARVRDFIDRATTAIRKARRSAVVVGFMTAAGLVLGAAIAWFACVAGGSHRDETPLSVNWRLIRSPRLTSG